jgi:hypothetical protein
MCRHAVVLAIFTLAISSNLVWGAPEGAADMRALLAGARVPYGILYDRVLPLSGIERFDGGSGRIAAGVTLWAQIYDELRRAGDESPLAPFRAFLDDALRSAGAGRVPVAVLNMHYSRVRKDAFERGLLTVREGRIEATGENPYSEERAFAACALRGRTYRGARVMFSFDRRWYVTNDAAGLRSIEADFDNGGGVRGIEPGGDVVVSYATIGTKRISLRAVLDNGVVLEAAFPFVVERLDTPTPNDTLNVTAAIPYAGVAGSGEAYVRLSTLNAQLTKPVIVIEGFDLDNTMNWDELYELLDQQNLADTLFNDGYDLVVLNFTDATDYIQRNAFVAVELIDRVVGMIDPRMEITLVGPSMGGLVGRYALAYMEHENIAHRIRTFISFDGPQRGADIPLGVQYWMQFFASESESAAYLLGRLDRPAARQMLLHHHTDPPTGFGEPDPLRTSFLSDLDSVGGYPQAPRLVAVANGSGVGAHQGFAAGEQLILYEYGSLLVDIIGNVWAVPDGSSTMIFDGLIDRIWPFPDDAMRVIVSGTSPLDGAPGGWRSSMYQMDTTQAPYGDIVALHPNHCFIPTISALDIDTEDPWYDIAGDPDIMGRTPFDAIYYPAVNEEHVTISAEGAQWLLDEILRRATNVGAPPVAAHAALHQNHPNPFNPSTDIEYYVPGNRRVTMEIYDISGRRIAQLARKDQGPGFHTLRWNGVDDRGNPVASGVYVCTLTAGDEMISRKMILLR